VKRVQGLGLAEANPESLQKVHKKFTKSSQFQEKNFYKKFSKICLTKLPKCGIMEVWPTRCRGRPGQSQKGRNYAPFSIKVSFIAFFTTVS
jgi:hypothetical protein